MSRMAWTLALVLTSICHVGAQPSEAYVNQVDPSSRGGLGPTGTFRLQGAPISCKCPKPPDPHLPRRHHGASMRKPRGLHQSVPNRSCRSRRNASSRMSAPAWRWPCHRRLLLERSPMWAPAWARSRNFGQWVRLIKSLGPLNQLHYSIEAPRYALHLASMCRGRMPVAFVQQILRVNLNGKESVSPVLFRVNGVDIGDQ
jgi:hypothetical protein